MKIKEIRIQGQKLNKATIDDACHRSQRSPWEFW
jgi:hypothetical protein